MISEKLMELLACPLCHDKLALTLEQGGLLCDRCKLVFPIRDGIPVLLPNEAQRISTSEPGVAEL